MVEHIEHLFPNLRGTPYQITRPPDEAYNCIAWAAGDTADPCWPVDPDVAQWPSDVPRIETLDAFCQAFATPGYAACSDDALEPGFEKIAMFADDLRVPKHAARQLRTGRWTSKLGKLEEIGKLLGDI
jgi:hypothetical protein